MAHGIQRQSRLSAENVTAIAAYGARTTWPAGFQIYQKGAAADGLSIVLHGHVILRNRIRAGRGFVPAIVTPGETFGIEGLTSDAVYVTDAHAADDAETLYITGSQFRAFVRENPTPALAIIGHLMHERAQLLEKLHAMASQNVEQRLISALDRLTADRSLMTTDGKLRIDVKHHRLLCEMVGATRESIALALGRLVGMGLAARRGVAFVIAPRDLANHITPSTSEGEATLPVVQEMTH